MKKSDVVLKIVRENRGIDEAQFWGNKGMSKQADLTSGSTTTMRGKDAKGVYTATLVRKKGESEHKEINRVYDTKEETEQIDELSKDTLYSYSKKSDADVEKKHKSLGQSIRKGDASGANKAAHQLNKRVAGMERAEKRLNNEEVGLSEASRYGSAYDNEHLTGYRGVGGHRRREPDEPHTQSGDSSSTRSHKLDQLIARGQARQQGKQSGKHYHAVPFHQRDDARKEGMKWDPGAKKWYHSSAEASSASKFRKEEVEQISELKKSTVKSYANKRQAQVDDAPSYPFVNKVPARISKNAGEGILRALKRMHGRAPTSEEVEIGEASYTGKGNHRPGWMLRADPELAKKFKERQELAKKRQKAYGDPAAGKSVGSSTNQ